uniref:Uncharacterized protein n=1 Tax=Oryza brachyantha TaxID=4533 RepID=J3KYH4_ORYBR
MSQLPISVRLGDETYGANQGFRSEDGYGDLNGDGEGSTARMAAVDGVVRMAAVARPGGVEDGNTTRMAVWTEELGFGVWTEQ